MGQNLPVVENRGIIYIPKSNMSKNHLDEIDIRAILTLD